MNDLELNRFKKEAFNKEPLEPLTKEEEAAWLSYKEWMAPPTNTTIDTNDPLFWSALGFVLKLDSRKKIAWQKFESEYLQKLKGEKKKKRKH